MTVDQPHNLIQTCYGAVRIGRTVAVGLALLVSFEWIPTPFELLDVFNFLMFGILVFVVTEGSLRWKLWRSCHATPLRGGWGYLFFSSCALSGFVAGAIVVQRSIVTFAMAFIAVVLLDWPAALWWTRQNTRVILFPRLLTTSLVIFTCCIYVAFAYPAVNIFPAATAAIILHESLFGLCLLGLIAASQRRAQIDDFESS